MKKIISIIVIAFFIFNNSYAQNDTMFVMKQGKIVGKYNVFTQVDSVVFYNPTLSTSKVKTVIIDTLKLSPIIVGGIVTVDANTTVSERGILFGITPNLSVSNSTFVGSFQFGLSAGGFGIPSTDNGKITSGSGNGSFSSNIMYLINNKTYYAKAYAITQKDTIYGDAIKFNTKGFVRDSRRVDITNVFWTSSTTLFDNLTDEIILPNSSGNFDIFYTSNEQPIVNQGTFTPTTLPNLLYYKFKTRENCQRWCDIKNGIIKQ